MIFMALIRPVTGSVVEMFSVMYVSRSFVLVFAIWGFGRPRVCLEVRIERNYRHQTVGDLLIHDGRNLAM